MTEKGYQTDLAKELGADEGVPGWMSRMRLKSAAYLLLGIAAITALVNLGMQAWARDTANRADAAFEQRQQVERLVDGLVHQTDLLAQLVQSYVATGDTQQLEVYFELAAVREGEQPQPEVPGGADVYWRERAAGQRNAMPMAAGTGQTLKQRLLGLNADAGTLSLAQAVVQASAPLFEMERVAFGAMQGMYDARTESFVSEAAKDPEFARAVVYSPSYRQARSNLTVAIERLHARVGQDVQTERANIRHLRDHTLWAVVGTNLALLVFAALLLSLVRRHMLRPLDALMRLTREFANGNYAARSRMRRGRLLELNKLTRALEGMAGAITDDLARREQLLREVDAARHAAEDAARARTAFLANMSHEIRTPMNAVMGMTQLVLQTELAPTQREHLQHALGASRHLLGLLNDVLDYSKIEAGGMTLENTEYQLEAVVSQALGMVRQDADANALELLCDYSDAALLGHFGWLLGDPLRLSQVLTNLLGNAVKFTQSGQVVLSLDTETRSDGQGLTFVVKVTDTGIGMTEAQLGGLFREFSQADASTTRRFGGTGLGLAITQRLVHLMDGEISVTSMPGAGSCFTVKLPLNSAPARSRVDEQRLAGVDTLRVLVVDDLPDTRAVLRSLLADLGIGSRGAIEATENGRATLAALDSAAAAGRPFDLVLLDAVLPDVRGLELLKQVRERHPGSRVVLVTAYGSTELHAEARQLGCDVSIAKPVLPQHLRALFEEATAPLRSRQAAPTWRLDGLRVLLVEDNALNREVAEGLLAGWGAHVSIATNGLESIERLRSEGPNAYDVVLMDLQMPVMDGDAAVQLLRTWPEFAHLPVLAMTANAMPGERERCLALGMQGYLTKPVDSDMLLMTLAPFLPKSMVATVAALLPAVPPSAKPSPVRQVHFDLAQVHRTCGGNQSLGRRLLRGFVRDHEAGLEDSWRPWIDTQAWPTLARAAHTLNGQAGMVGALALQQAAHEMEGFARTGDAQGALAHLPQLDRQVFLTVEAVTQAAAQSREQETTFGALDEKAAGTAAQATDAASGADLAELAAMLQDGDAGALEWWRAHERQLRQILSPQACHRMGRAINDFDFSYALIVLAKPSSSLLGDLP